MPPNVRSLRYTQRQVNFDGGLNIASPPSEIADNELVVCDNMWYHGGNLNKRPGFFKLTNTPLADDNLTILDVDGNGVAIVGSVDGGNMWSISQTPTVTAITGTGAQVPMWTYLISGTRYVGFYGTFGVRILAAGAIAGATIANSPQSSAAAFHKGRIFSNVLGSVGRVAFSSSITSLAPVATWTSTDILDIGTEDGELITAMASLGDLLLIFKLNSMYVLYVQGDSPANWVARKINGSVGCAPASGSNPLYLYNGEAYFISRLGLWKTNGQSFVNLSKNMWIPEDPKYQFTNPTFGMWRVTGWDDTLIITGRQLSPSILGYTYTYNINTGAWTTWSFLGNSLGFDDIYCKPGYGFLYAISTRGNNVYSSSEANISRYDFGIAAGINTYADGFLNNSLGAGSAYTALFQTKDFTSFTDWLWRSKWIGLEYTSYTPGPTIGVMADGISVASAIPGFNTIAKTYKSAGAGRCRAFSFSCSHSAASPFQFNRANLHYAMKRAIIASGAP